MASYPQALRVRIRVPKLAHKETSVRSGHLPSTERINFGTGCFLAEFGVMEHDDPMGPCDGRLIRAHLIPRQLIFREFGVRIAEAAIADPRSWVPACGGPTGCSGHHGAFDQSKKLRLPRSEIPRGTLELAAELGLMPWMDRTYPKGD